MENYGVVIKVVVFLAESLRLDFSKILFFSKKIFPISFPGFFSVFFFFLFSSSFFLPHSFSFLLYYYLFDLGSKYCVFM